MGECRGQRRTAVRIDGRDTAHSILSWTQPVLIVVAAGKLRHNRRHTPGPGYVGRPPGLGECHHPAKAWYPEMCSLQNGLEYSLPDRRSPHVWDWSRPTDLYASHALIDDRPEHLSGRIPFRMRSSPFRHLG